MRDRAPPAHRQRGLSMVELLIGATLGALLVVAGITVLLLHLRESRALTEQNRLMQDLRSAAEMIARDLRRSGHWADAGSGVWLRTEDVTQTTVSANPYATLQTSAAPWPGVSLSYSRDDTENQRQDSNEQFGFRLRNEVLEMRIGAANWQAMTDTGTMKVIALAFEPHVVALDLSAMCSAVCASGDSLCPPRQIQRRITLTLSARSASDASTIRSVRTEVRLRNDEITGRCPA